jgi:PadR family transcriptional regulator
MPPDHPPTQVLPKNFLRPCLLLLLREHPAHGYDLLERLRPLGFNRDDPGRLYRALRALENDGLVRSVWEKSSSGPDRRMYELTREGMQTLHDSVIALRLTNELLDVFLSRRRRLRREARPQGARGARVTRRRGAVARPPGRERRWAAARSARADRQGARRPLPALSRPSADRINAHAPSRRAAGRAQDACASEPCCAVHSAPTSRRISSIAAAAGER